MANAELFLMQNRLKVRIRSGSPLSSISFFLNQQSNGVFPPTGTEFYFDGSRLPAGAHNLSVLGTAAGRETPAALGEFSFLSAPKRDFQPGDILVSCDNANGLPPGYMGHSAIVISEDRLIEAVMQQPFIREDTIQQFLDAHPTHAQFRSKSPETGLKAVNTAKYYLETFLQNVTKGTVIPPFSFSPNIPLDDPWSSVYCSKLVWLCYRYGANYPFYHDGFLFAPEDLESVLRVDSNFLLVYKHFDFEFKVDL